MAYPFNYHTVYILKIMEICTLLQKKLPEANFHDALAGLYWSGIIKPKSALCMI